MSTREALEHSLQTAWSFDDLAVYADHLQGDGDPRGELVALDLAPSPVDRNWWVRRRAALAGWLGAELADRASHLVQHGVIHELRGGAHPPALLDGPLGDVVRGYTIWGHGRVTDALADLASRPRPWLVRLSITNWSRRRLDNATRDALIAATPNLHELVLAGYPIVRAFAHPSVRRLVVEERSLPVLPDRRARAAVRAHALGVDPSSEVRVIELRTGRSGPELSATTILELRDLISAVPDCGKLAAEHDRFAEPMPVLLARLAAAGIIELEGPIARLAPGESAYAPWIPFVPPRAFTVHAGEARVAIRSARTHADLIAARLGGFRMRPASRAALASYRNKIANASLRELSATETRALAIALTSLLELRGMEREELGAPSAWLELEQLATLLVGADTATATWD